MDLNIQTYRLADRQRWQNFGNTKDLKHREEWQPLFVAFSELKMTFYGLQNRLVAFIGL